MVPRRTRRRPLGRACVARFAGVAARTPGTPGSTARSRGAAAVCAAAAGGRVRAGMRRVRAGWRAGTIIWREPSSRARCPIYVAYLFLPVCCSWRITASALLLGPKEGSGSAPAACGASRVVRRVCWCVVGVGGVTQLSQGRARWRQLSLEPSSPLLLSPSSPPLLSAWLSSLLAHSVKRHRWCPFFAAGIVLSLLRPSLAFVAAILLPLVALVARAARLFVVAYRSLCIRGPAGRCRSVGLPASTSMLALPPCLPAYCCWGSVAAPAADAHASFAQPRACVWLRRARGSPLPLRLTSALQCLPRLPHQLPAPLVPPRVVTAGVAGAVVSAAAAAAAAAVSLHHCSVNSRWCAVH